MGTLSRYPDSKVIHLFIGHEDRVQVRKVPHENLQGDHAFVQVAFDSLIITQHHREFRDKMACPPSIRFAIIAVLWLNGLVGVASFSLGCRRCALTTEMLSRCLSQPSNARDRMPTHSDKPRKRQSGLSRLFSSSPEMSEHRGIQRVLRFFRRLLIAPLVRR